VAGKSKLATRHRDRWVLLDTVIIEPEQANGPCVLDMPLLFDDGKYRVEIDSALVREAALEAQAAGDARVLFAAQLSEIRPPSDKDGIATVVLNGKTAFLWTTLETYTSLGYAETREEQLQLTRDLITRQLELSETAK
jgi:hypothetical protein